MRLFFLHVNVPGVEVIKLEFILRLKIKHNDWLLADTCPQADNHLALFEFENELKSYNLEVRSVYGKQKRRSVTFARF